MKTGLLVGCPNSGKSSLFNLLSGEERKVSNYAGITVDTGLAELKSNKEGKEKVQIVDLPGLYGLLPSSVDEAITTATLLGLNDQIKKFHQVVLVVDFSKLEASLALALAVKDLFGQNVVIIVNKSDLSYRSINCGKLEKLMGLKVLACSTFKDDGKKIDEFIRQNIASSELQIKKAVELSSKSLDMMPFVADSQWIKLNQNEQEILSQTEELQKKAREIVSELLDNQTQEISLANLTRRMDRVLLHPVLGSIIFFSIFYILFHALYSWSSPMMDFIETQVSNLGELIGGLITNPTLNSLVIDGVFAGVGGVLVFLPQIMMLFFLLSLLEQSGYIARAAILTDKVMSYFDLNGKAFLPYLSGFACSIPAIMATRTIADRRERLATLLTIPLITCSARLPVFVLLIGTFIPDTSIAGIFNARALSFFFLYFLGSFVALVMAKLFRLSFFKGKTQSFYIELPLYQRPFISVAVKGSIAKGKVFLKKAGTTIFALSILIWLASSYPKPKEEMLQGKTEAEVAALSLESSAMGSLGKMIEPVIKPLGYDWKMGVGLLIAFGARELFVSGLGTIYALGDVDEESTTLRERLMDEKNSVTGAPVYNLATAWSLLIFFAFACQCISTLAIVRKETESLKWPMFMFGYMGLLAYTAALGTYHFVNWLT